MANGLSPIVQQAILQSGQVPDIVGAFQRGREQRRAEQARALMGQTLQQQGLGGPLAELAGVDPNAAAALAQATGIPITERGRQKQFAENARLIFEIGKNDPQEAFRRTVAIRNDMAARGLPTDITDSFISEMQTDPATGLQNLGAFVDANVRAGIIAPTSLEVASKKAVAEKKKEQQKQVNVLRRSVEKAENAFNEVAGAAKRIKAVAKGTPAGDLALIFNFMKMVDPGSVVRESEFRTAEDAKAWLVEQEEVGIPVPAPIANFIRRAKEGTLLEPGQRKDFIEQAESLLIAQRSATDNRLSGIISQAEQDEIENAGPRILGTKPFRSFSQRISSEGQRLRAPVRQPAVRETVTVTPQAARQTTTVQPQQQPATIPEGQTATNPQTGEKVIFRNGRWEPI